MLNIVIPMAGMSSRFTRAGFTLPKYMLYLGDKSLFFLVMRGFENYFKTAHFIFICRDLFDTPGFIIEECNRLGLNDYYVHVLDKTTSGQAETVYLGVKDLASNESILVYNIDSIHEPMLLPEWTGEVDGFLEVFEGSGTNWSYAKTEDGTAKTQVIETAEKSEISRFCSTGLYYFSQVSDFLMAYERSFDILVNGERYVAPLYNALIERGRIIKVNVIDKSGITFCGVPEEYFDCLSRSVF